ncbi:hypothetical protein FDC50_10155 [Clostridium botulinum]|nr:hypothetical protein [Clostridium botulinum]MBY6804354.1 hypothetical protein [Clostridium botulinum]MBY6813317.1 hypothetical protein [Clostridium botulinum]MBY6821949.1 hypothetical protein [Clostridium botulinum]MBY6851713.1 hypothetical protein [Clostridium botulinum]
MLKTDRNGLMKILNINKNALKQIERRNTLGKRLNLKGYKLLAKDKMGLTNVYYIEEYEFIEDKPSNKAIMTKKEKRRIYRKRYEKKHKEQVKERRRKYSRTNSFINSTKIYQNNRRAREKYNQYNSITLEQWKECLRFFDNKCAYSGEQKEDDRLSLDHVLALSNDGDNLIYNVVPAINKYNINKGEKLFLPWYKKQSFFSEERLNKIYEWQIYAKNKFKQKGTF